MHRWAHRRRRVIAARLRAASQYSLPKTLLLLVGLSPWLLFASCELSDSRRGLGGGAGQALSQSQDLGDLGQDLSVEVDQDLGLDAGLDFSGSVTCIPAPPNLVAWYTADLDGSDLVQANNGVLSPATRIVTGQVGNAFRFDGPTDAVSIDSSAANDFEGGQDFTLEAWIAAPPGTDCDHHCSILYKSDAAREVGYSFFLFGSGAGLQLGLQLADGVPQGGRDRYDNYQQQVSGLFDGQFHHVAASVSHANGSVTLYVDGAVLGQALPFQSPRGSLRNDTRLLIGGPAHFSG